MLRVVSLLLAMLALGSCTPLETVKVWHVAPSGLGDAAIRQDMAAIDRIFADMGFQGSTLDTGAGSPCRGPEQESPFLYAANYLPGDRSRDFGAGLFVRRQVRALEIVFSSWPDSFNRANTRVIDDFDARLRTAFAGRVTSFGVRKRGMCED
jgi:hypothetical protein